MCFTSSAAPQTGAAYSRARVLCERLGDVSTLFATLSGEFTYHFVRGDYRMMRQTTDEAWRTSDRTADPKLRLAAHRSGIRRVPCCRRAGRNRDAAK